MLGRLVLHASNYTIGIALVTLASIISFPVFTRMFSVAEYGTLNLISSTLLFLTGLGKLGIQHSIVRFHAEVKADKRAENESQFLSTVIFGMAAISGLVTIGCAIGALFIPDSWWNDDRVSPLLLCASVLIVIRVLDSGILNILRAQQRSALYSSLTVIRKYLGLAGILGILVYVIGGLPGFFVGTIITECAALAVLLMMFARETALSTRQFSKPLLLAMLAFGLPMVGSELSSILLNIGGRYVIQGRMGAEALGSYSAAYNFCDYVQSIITVAFGQAVGPIYTRLWEEKGEAETRKFIEQALRFYIILALGVLAGMSAVGSEVLTVLATERYQPGAVLIPFLTAGMLVSGGIPIFSAGIYLHKQTRVIMILVMVAAVINIVLTTVLIPAFGIMGAGFSTLVSFVLFAAGAAHFGRQALRVSFPWADFAKFSVLAAIMYLCVSHLPQSDSPWDVLLRIATGLVCYVALALATDRTARAALRFAIDRLRAMLARPRASKH